ncbi:hypothetical protein C8F04DRAFT_1397989 [Mycena alexandri]|uniref:DUF6533 domain-containing protein n=1 Tax=Mycena alexandri TaxID=1745969 RepID=A0AAD6WYR6_9AGAR|nr:hypothetical protein C8F04DRAFT_1397989 [Mycena alexandri]
MDNRFCPAPVRSRGGILHNDTPLVQFAFPSRSGGFYFTLDMSSDPAMAYGHWFTDAWFLVALVVLAYDHCLTLESEIKFIWQKSKRFSFFFIALRYTSLFINIGMVIFVFSNVPPEALFSCHALSIGRIALLIVQSVLGGIGLGMRIYVMYNFSRTVVVFLSCVGILVTVLAAWSITGGDGWILATGFDGCQYAVSKSRAIRMAGAWGAQLVFFSAPVATLLELRNMQTIV